VGGLLGLGKTDKTEKTSPNEKDQARKSDGPSTPQAWDGTVLVGWRAEVVAARAASALNGDSGDNITPHAVIGMSISPPFYPETTTNDNVDEIDNVNVNVNVNDNVNDNDNDNVNVNDNDNVNDNGGNTKNDDDAGDKEKDNDNNSTEINSDGDGSVFDDYSVSDDDDVVDGDEDEGDDGDKFMQAQESSEFNRSQSPRLNISGSIRIPRRDSVEMDPDRLSSIATELASKDGDRVKVALEFLMSGDCDSLLAGMIDKKVDSKGKLSDIGQERARATYLTAIGLLYYFRYDDMCGFGRADSGNNSPRSSSSSNTSSSSGNGSHNRSPFDTMYLSVLKSGVISSDTLSAVNVSITDLLQAQSPPAAQSIRMAFGPLL
jgi:hypothetical protein